MDGIFGSVTAGEMDVWGLWDSEHFIVYESGLTLIQAAAQTVTLTVEVSDYFLRWGGVC